MTGRFQMVQVGEEISTKTCIQYGFPQGSGLSPLLFVIFTACMPESCVLGQLILYAYDTTVIFWGNNLEEWLDRASAAHILEYMDSNKLASNPEKTQFIIFGGGAQRCIFIGESEIHPSTCVTLLGLKVNGQLRWAEHIREIETELAQRIGVLYRLRQHVTQSTLLSVMNGYFF
jgi:hypothetical protein